MFNISPFFLATLLAVASAKSGWEAGMEQWQAGMEQFDAAMGQLEEAQGQVEAAKATCPGGLLVNGKCYQCSDGLTSLSGIKCTCGDGSACTVTTAAVGTTDAPKAPAPKASAPAKPPKSPPSPTNGENIMGEVEADGINDTEDIKDIDTVIGVSEAACWDAAPAGVSKAGGLIVSMATNECSSGGKTWTICPGISQNGVCYTCNDNLNMQVVNGVCTCDAGDKCKSTPVSGAMRAFVLAPVGLMLAYGLAYLP